MNVETNFIDGPQSIFNTTPPSPHPLLRGIPIIFACLGSRAFGTKGLPEGGEFELKLGG